MDGISLWIVILGVDIFLLVSGLGLWYSLTSLNGNNVQQGVRCWYLRRYKRILIPYLIIIGFHYTLSVLHGMPISQALFELSTLSYWVNHQGAWFIAMPVSYTHLKNCWAISWWIHLVKIWRHCISLESDNAISDYWLWSISFKCFWRWTF